jgi:DNA-3-methyladenine glycosylase I
MTKFDGKEERNMSYNLHAIDATRRKSHTTYIETSRCWPTDDALLLDYHDNEWGIPLHDDQLLFELFTLQGFRKEAGWLAILRKRGSLRRAFDNFDFGKIALYSRRKIDSLQVETGIGLHRSEIEAVIANALAFIGVREHFGSFDNYIWGFTGGTQIIGELYSLDAIPSRSGLSDFISLDLRKRGFKHSGSTYVHAYMQAMGLVNDHLVDCFRHQIIAAS